MYLPNISQWVVPSFFIFIISIIFSIFSPLGIGFIVFSIIRWKTESEALKKTSLVFQIVLSCLTLLIGLLISLLFVIRGSPLYSYSSDSWIYMLALLFGVGFVIIIFIGIIVWQTKVLNKIN